MEQHQLPAYGQRLLIHLIDERAAAGHLRPYASIPISNDVNDGFRDITYRTFANAINRAATWLQGRFGTPSNLETVVYIGPTDLRYQILALAANKSGHVMFFPSPRNTPDAFRSLLEQSGATKIITGSNNIPSIATLIAERSMDHAPCPSLNELLDDNPVPHIAVEATFEIWRFRPWIFLHTSGSTGLPKLVPVKHGVISGYDAFHLAPESDQTLRYGNMRVFVAFPPFHIAGISFSLTCMCWFDSTAVFAPPGVPLTADLVHRIHTLGNVLYSTLAPSLLADLTNNPEYLEGLGRLKGLTFAGGPLAVEVAEKASQKVVLSSSIGATEFGGIPMILAKDPKYYNYFQFNEELAGIQFQETEQPGLYELVFVRKSTFPSHLVQGVFVTFPELNEYHTKDIFSKHPTEPGLWKYEARLDDVIVLSNGEKFNPVPMEGSISSCPAVKGCLVVGQGRFQAALLLELRHDELSRKEAMRQIIPFVEEANRLCPAYGKIVPELIFFITEAKQLARAAKGTIQRARSNAIFSEEINDLYQNVSLGEKSSKSTGQPILDLNTAQSTEASLRDWMLRNVNGATSESTQNIFEAGADSLSVISLLRAINASLPSGRPKLDQVTIYNNPSIAKLVDVLHPDTDELGFDDLDSDAEEAAEKQTWSQMEKLFLELRGPISTRSAAAKSQRNNFLRSERPPPVFPPDSGLVAWSQVLASFLINMNNWGLVNSFGVYQAYYERSLLAGYSGASISWIGTIQGSLLLMVGVVSGPLFDMGYFHATMIVASLGLVFGMMMLSLATTYYQIFLAQGVLVGLCLGLLYIPSVALIPLYFKKWRGTALGLATAGGSVGGIIYPIIFARLIDALDFAWACRIIAFVSLATLSVAAWLIQPVGMRSTGVRQLFDPHALKDMPYLFFLSAGFLVFCGVLVPFFLVTEFAAVLTPDSNLAFYCATFLNAAQLVGRVVPAAVSDWSRKPGVPGPEAMLLFAQAAAGVVAFCWISVATLPGYIVWLCVYGFLSGMNVTLAAVVLPYICPDMAVLGTRLGMLYAVAGLGFLISTPVALAANQASGGYLGSQSWTGACCLAGALFNVVTAREARRRRKLYETRKFRRI